jgi:hypothetical protein
MVPKRCFTITLLGGQKLTICIVRQTWLQREIDRSEMKLECCIVARRLNPAPAARC